MPWLQVGYSATWDEDDLQLAVIWGVLAFSSIRFVVWMIVGGM